LISLSPATVNNLDRIREVIEGINEDALSVLPKREREPFRKVIVDMIAALEALLDEEPSATPERARRTRKA
jgi:hypothetical protein